MSANDSDEFNEVCCVARCLYFIEIFVCYLFIYLLVPKGTGLVRK